MRKQLIAGLLVAAMVLTQAPSLAYAADVDTDATETVAESADESVDETDSSEDATEETEKDNEANVSTQDFTDDPDDPDMFEDDSDEEDEDLTFSFGSYDEDEGYTITASENKTIKMTITNKNAYQIKSVSWTASFKTSDEAAPQTVDIITSDKTTTFADNYAAATTSCPVTVNGEKLSAIPGIQDGYVELEATVSYIGPEGTTKTLTSQADIKLDTTNCPVFNFKTDLSVGEVYDIGVTSGYFINKKGKKLSLTIKSIKSSDPSVVNVVKGVSSSYIALSGEGYGTADVTITYRVYKETKNRTYTIPITVTNTDYVANIETESSATNLIPGQSVNVSANVTDQEGNEPADDLTYEWEITDETLASYEKTGENTIALTVSSEKDDEGYIASENDIVLNLTVKDADGKTIATTSTTYAVSDEMYEFNTLDDNTIFANKTFTYAPEITYCHLNESGEVQQEAIDLSNYDVELEVSPENEAEDEDEDDESEDESEESEESEDEEGPCSVIDNSDNTFNITYKATAEECYDNVLDFSVTLKDASGEEVCNVSFSEDVVGIYTGEKEYVAFPVIIDSAKITITPNGSNVLADSLSCDDRDVDYPVFFVENGTEFNFKVNAGGRTINYLCENEDVANADSVIKQNDDGTYTVDPSETESAMVVSGTYKLKSGGLLVQGTSKYYIVKVKMTAKGDFSPYLDAANQKIVYNAANDGFDIYVLKGKTALIWVAPKEDVVYSVTPSTTITKTRYDKGINCKFKVSKATTLKVKPHNTITATVKNAKGNDLVYSTKAQTAYVKATALESPKFTYKSNTKNVSVNSAGKVTVKAKFFGTASITVKSAESATYGVTSETITFNVGQATGAITAKNITKTMSAKAQTIALGASANNGATLSYQVTGIAGVIGDTTADLSNTTITIKKGKAIVPANFAGTITIAITAANGTKYYTAAPDKIIQLSLVPSAVSVSKVTNLAGFNIQMNWKAKTGIDGYQVVCSKSKTVTAADAIDISDLATTSYTFNAGAKGTYYVSIRCFKNINGVPAYSSWKTTKVSVKK